ncbi:hypothetical protein U9M48_026695 [Paspalum notatum var. saurae]|uniref:Uncharacterized protein n=1 Tax=Paspalum notatum var. saurae TaxID=547442 RepID=A0AAQ3TT77_PASNO
MAGASWPCMRLHPAPRRRPSDAPSCGRRARRSGSVPGAEACGYSTERLLVGLPASHGRAGAVARCRRPTRVAVGPAAPRRGEGGVRLFAGSRPRRPSVLWPQCTSLLRRCGHSPRYGAPNGVVGRCCRDKSTLAAAPALFLPRFTLGLTASSFSSPYAPKEPAVRGAGAAEEQTAASPSSSSSTSWRRGAVLFSATWWRWDLGADAHGMRHPACCTPAASSCLPGAGLRGVGVGSPRGSPSLAPFGRG